MTDLRGVARAIGVALLVSMAVACGEGGSTDAAPGSTAAAPPERGEAVTLSNGDDRAYFFGEKDVTGLGDVTIVANYSQDPSVYYFSPTVLIGEPGQALRITVKNRAFQSHTFTLDEQGIDRQISPRTTETIEVVFPEEGGLIFYCAYHFGSSAFQAGELRVR